MKIKKALAVLVLLALMITTASGLCTVEISAVTETYQVSEEYKSSKYYEHFGRIELTGDQATDVLAIALSQLGYHEGDGDADLDGMNASGTKNGPKAQELVYKYTTDMKNWSDVQVAMSCTDKENMRPGMIAISKTPVGYIMTYELVGLSGSPTYCKIVDKLDDWGDIADVGFPIVADNNKTMGTAPWSAWTPAGGENGIFFSVANHMIECEAIDGTGTDMFVSLDYGKTNIAIENPSTFVQNRKNKLSYSSYLGFSEDGYTMYYMNSINLGPDNTQIEFVRIKIAD